MGDKCFILAFLIHNYQFKLLLFLYNINVPYVGYNRLITLLTIQSQSTCKIHIFFNDDCHSNK
jgi:hypothetical protein